MTKFINLLLAILLVISNLQANLTYENLANTSYNKSSNLNISANLAFGNKENSSNNKNENSVIAS